MLLFHGGLPRSGKSYESVVEHLIPALKKGRKVYARIDGLNYEKLAALAEISLERCQDLLVHLTEGQVATLEKIPFEIGSMVIIDEAQNYWQDSRRPLSAELTKFVAEHGHKGLDILLMGQEFKDLHKLWKNRVSQRVQFVKLDMVGKGNKYSWVLFKATHPQKFIEVTRGSKEYDAKYFGTYKSFEEGAETGQLYSDKRANIFNSKMFRRWLPLYALILIAALFFIWRLFWGGGLAESVNKHQPVQKRNPADYVQGKKPSTVPPPVAEKPATPSKPKQQDLIADLCEKYRLRVTAIIKTADREQAMFEWYDDSLRVKERMTMYTVVKLGYTVALDDDMQFATVSKADVRFIATQFPSETEARVPEKKIQEISQASDHPDHLALDDKPAKRDESNSADGYGVLGRVGAGPRKPGDDVKSVNRT